MIRRNKLVVLTALVVALGFSTALLGGNDSSSDKSKSGDVQGTVSSIDNSSINVKMPSGDTKNIAINNKTKYTKGTDSAAIADVQPGTTVVIRLAPDGSAMEVRLIPVETNK